MPGTFSYDPLSTGPLSAVYRLRRYMSDTNVEPMASGLAAGRATALFSDQEYQAFLNDANGDVTYAWYLALTAAAINAELASVDTDLSGGGSVNYAGRADRLFKQAQTVLELWRNLPYEEYAEQNSGPAAAERIIWNAFMRQWGAT